MEWIKVFQEWLEDCYTPEMVALAYRLSRPNKKPWRTGFAVTGPHALSRTLNEVQGLLAKGETFVFDDDPEPEAEQKQYWGPPV